MTDPAAGRLARALEEAGAPSYFIQRVRDGVYDHFRSRRVNQPMTCEVGFPKAASVRPVSDIPYQPRRRTTKRPRVRGPAVCSPSAALAPHGPATSDLLANADAGRRAHLADGGTEVRTIGLA